MTADAFFWYFEKLCEQYAAAMVYGRDGRPMKQHRANALQAHLDALAKERVAGKEKKRK